MTLHGAAWHVVLALWLACAGPGGVRAQEAAPAWGAADIRASRIETPGARELPARPLWRADPLNLFVVVEAGDHHVSLVDGERFERIHRFRSRDALQAGAKFSAGGRYVYFASRDGWITQYDLWNLTVVAEVRAGLNTRNLAVGGDGRWVMVANHLPHTLVLLDGDLQLVKVFDATTRDGRKSSRVSAVYDAAPRSSFVVALKDIPELWEISYDPAAADLHEGLVHDFRLREGAFEPGFLGVRRTLLDEQLDDFFFDQGYANVLGTARPRADGSSAGQVVNLDVRRRIAELPIAGLPHLGSGITFAWNGTTVLASPNLRDGSVAVIDMKDWRLLRTIAVPGPGFFLRSHERTPYAWTDSMMSSTARDTLTLIDKRTLAVAASVREPGRTLAQVAFTRDGRHAVAGIPEPDGALVVYDAVTLREVRRLPMRTPAGVYNVGNELGRPEGLAR